MNKNKKIYRILLYGVALCVILIGLSACDLFQNTDSSAEDLTPYPPVVQDTNIKAEGRLVPRDSIQLVFEMNGEVVEILFDEGDLVQQGDVIARLGDHETLEAAFSMAELELLSAQQGLQDLNDNADLIASRAWQELVAAQVALNQAQQRLEDLDTTEYADEIDTAREEVANTRDELDTASEDFEQYKDLETDNPTRKRYEDALDNAEEKYNTAYHELENLLNALEQAKADVQAAQAQLDDAQVTYEQSGPDPDDVALAEARISNAQAQLAAAQVMLDNNQLLAPFTGTLVDFNLVLNQRVTAFQPVALLADLSEWYVETTDLTEIEVVDISEGQSVSIVPDSLPDVTLTGEVVSIDDTFKERYGDITYTVRVRLDNIDERLRWGMTMALTFEK